MAKKSKKMIEWVEERKAEQEPAKPMTREEAIKAMSKNRSKRPMIKSSHGG